LFFYLTFFPSHFFSFTQQVSVSSSLLEVASFFPNIYQLCQPSVRCCGLIDCESAYQRLLTHITDIMSSEDVQFPLVFLNAVDPLGFKGYLTKAGIFAGLIGASEGHEYTTPDLDPVVTVVAETHIFEAGTRLCGIDMDFTGRSSAVGLILTPNQSYILLPGTGIKPASPIVKTDGSILTRVRIDMQDSLSVPVLSTSFSEPPTTKPDEQKDTSGNKNVLVYIGIGVAVVVVLVCGALLIKGNTSLETFYKPPPRRASKTIATIDQEQN
jgi:hypothetical protein